MEGRIAGYDPGRHEEKPGTLRLHRNENLFASSVWSAETVRGIVADVEAGAYPDPECRALREELARRLGVRPKNVHVGNGSDEVLAGLFALFRESSDSLAVADVGFGMYPVLADRYRYRLTRIPGDTFRTGELGRTDAGVVVIDSPNSITGARWSAAHLEATAAARNAFLVWDNAYGEYAGDEVPGPSPNRVVVRTFSKFYGLANLRIGYCVAEPAIVEALQRRKDPFNVNGVAQRFALEALRRHDELAARAAEMQRCRAALASVLLAFGFEVRESATNFLLVAHEHLDAGTLRAGLAERGILVRRFPGGPAANHLRFTVPPAAGVERVHEGLRDMLGASGPTESRAFPG